MSESFLCGHCKSVMCSDCREIAEEYHELLLRRSQALASANAEVDRLKAELVNMTRRADMYEQVSKCGLPNVILAWMDKEIGELLSNDPATRAEKV